MNTELSPAIQAMLAKSNVTKVDEMESGGGGVPRISLKKSKFTAKNGDEELKLGEEINVVILGITPPHGFSRTYYVSGYQPGSADAPDCQSSDGIRPDSFVDNPESAVCRTCPQAIWGSAKSMSGGKAKACKDSKRLYVKLAEELDDQDKPIYLLNVTVLSLKPFGAYGKKLAAEGIPTPSIVITKLSFDEEASVPKLEFDLVGVLNDEVVPKALELAEAKSWDTKIVTPETQLPGKQEAKAMPEATSTEIDTTVDVALDGSELDNW